MAFNRKKYRREYYLKNKGRLLDQQKKYYFKSTNTENHFQYPEFIREEKKSSHNHASLLHLPAEKFKRAVNKIVQGEIQYAIGHFQTGQQLHTES